MANEIQKLHRFKDAVFADVERRVSEIISQAEAEKEEKVSKAEKATKSYKKEHFSTIDKEQAQRLTRDISAARLDSQRSVLLHREQLVDRVFESVKKKLDEYRNTDSYGNWLIKTALEAKELYKNENGKIQLSNADSKYADLLKEITGFEVELLHTIVLGGIMINFESINVVLDSTFDAAIEDERQNFCLTAELAVGQD